MAISDTREVDIDATPAEILDVIADVESTPEWSSAQQRVEVLDRHDDGRPRQVKMTVKSVGITDDQVVSYRWGENTVSWSLVSAGQLKAQDATYTLTPRGGQTHVRFDLAVDPLVPLPGFLLKRALKGAMDTATDGLRTRVMTLKKG